MADEYLNAKKFIGKVAKAVFYNRFVPTVVNNQKGIYEYGSGNLLPNDNLKLINDSGPAKRAAKKLKQYIEADGFQEEGQEVPEGIEPGALLNAIAGQMSYFYGFALHISRYTEGTIKNVRPIAFEGVRVRKAGGYKYNPLLGQPGFKDKDTKIYAPFEKAVLTPEELAAQIQDYPAKNGEILYSYDLSPDNPYYPVPDYYAAIEDIKTSIELAGLDLETVKNGFLPGGILVTENINDTDKDDKDKTPYDYFKEELQKFTGQVKNKDNEAGRMRLLHIMVSTMDQAPRLQSYDAKAVLEAAIKKRKLINQEVSLAFGVPPEILGYTGEGSSLIGNTEAQANASNELNNYVAPLQALITRAFTELFPGNDWELTRFTPIKFIPPSILDRLSDDEVRELYKLPAKQVEDPNPPTP